jgi:hypothetical protein
MKKSCLTITVAVFLSIWINGLQAQTTQTKLNQVELKNQLLGSWKIDYAKDTTGYIDFTSYGTGVDGNMKYVSKGKVVLEVRIIWGYD